MATTARLLTYDDYAALPDEGKRYELIGGELWEMPSPSWNHQMVLSRLNKVLDRFVSARELGAVVFAPFDIRLSPNVVVQPDIVYVSTGRLASVAPQFLMGAPDLLVEVLSPSTRDRDLGVKLRLYADARVREVWFADLEPPDLRILAMGDDGDYVPVPPVGGAVQSVVLPGLRVDIAALFTGLPAAS